jgi:ABC-type branched-subunit amino acid transport system substrate-binding protein
MSFTRSRHAGTIALAAVALVATAACGASPRVEREVAARTAAALHAGNGGSAGSAADAALGAGAGSAPGSLPDASAGAAGADPSAAGTSAAGGSTVGGSGAGGSAVSAGGTRSSGAAGSARSGPSAASSAGAAAGSGLPSASPAGSAGAGGGAAPALAGGAAAPAGGNGGATDVGVTANSIKVGGTFFNGGYLDKYSQVAEQAASAYFKYVNDHGGVFGRKIEYVPCDTAGTADGTQGCLRKLANDDKVFAMGPSLDFNLDTVPTFLADKKLPWVGSSGLYPEEHKSPFMFPSQIPGADVGVHIASFAKKTLGAATIGVSYLTDGAGPSCTESIKSAAARLGYQVVVTVENSQTQGDMTQQVLKVKQANPDTVLFCNDPINNVKFIQAAGRVGYKPPKGWIGGFVAVEDVPKSMGAAGVGFYGLCTFDFFGGNSPGVAQYRQITQSYFPSMFHHFYTQAAFVGARALVEAITKAGPQLTRQNLLTALASMTDFDSSMGLHFDFSKKASRSSGLMIQADENLRWKQVSDRFSAE